VTINLNKEEILNKWGNLTKAQKTEWLAHEIMDWHFEKMYFNWKPLSNIEHCWYLVEAMRKNNFHLNLFYNVDGHVNISLICNNGPCKLHGTNFYSYHGCNELEYDNIFEGISLACLIAKLDKRNRTL